MSIKPPCQYIILLQDPEEAPDYDKIIEKPMDLTRIMDKVNNGEYICLDDYLQDIDLLVENTKLYYPAHDPDKIVYRAKSLQDVAYSLSDGIDDELVSLCSAIAVSRRKIHRSLNSLQDRPSVTISKQDTAKDHPLEHVSFPSPLNSSTRSQSPKALSALEVHFALVDDAIDTVQRPSEETSHLPGT